MHILYLYIHYAWVCIYIITYNYTIYDRKRERDVHIYVYLSIHVCISLSLYLYICIQIYVYIYIYIKYTSVQSIVVICEARMASLIKKKTKHTNVHLAFQQRWHCSKANNTPYPITPSAKFKGFGGRRSHGILKPQAWALGDQVTPSKYVASSLKGDYPRIEK